MQSYLPKVNPTETHAWKQLTARVPRLLEVPMTDFLTSSEYRKEPWNMEAAGWYLDYSKHCLDQEGLQLLYGLAGECGVQEGIEAMWSGKAVNETEGRAVLHPALRDPEGPWMLEDGSRPGELAGEVLARMEAFVGNVLSGTYRGSTGEAFTDIVNIGIGGSDLGPLMACEALSAYRNHLSVHFVSNVDGAHLRRTLTKVDASRTLFLVASKTFTTQETMANARTAKAWLLEQLGDSARTEDHFVAMSTNRTEVQAFGIRPDRMFPFWDWVGGRYSLWSAIGLSVALAVGFEHYRDLLRGARAMDRHFRETPWESNLPVTLALLGIWNRNFLEIGSLAVLPYDQCLSRFPAYLQQADMESNGKSVDRRGEALTYHSGPVLWGEPGTNGQHAFYQLVHQGTQKVACDFVLAATSLYPGGEHHKLLSANAFAQAQALLQGRSSGEVLDGVQAAGLTADPGVWPHQVFQGSRPSNFLMCQRLTPSALGALIALYEHKILVQGLIWNIYSFDQWGVELGKVLAQRLIPLLEGSDAKGNTDLSTLALIRRWRSWQTETP